MEALLARASAGFPPPTGLPETFAALRHELGARVYGSMGITRDDADGRRIAQLRNWEFFRAPVAGVVCMHRDLGLVDSLGVGLLTCGGRQRPAQQLPLGRRRATVRTWVTNSPTTSRSLRPRSRSW